MFIANNILCLHSHLKFTAFQLFGTIIMMYAICLYQFIMTCMTNYLICVYILIYVYIVLYVYIILYVYIYIYSIVNHASHFTLFIFHSGHQCAWVKASTKISPPVYTGLNSFQTLLMDYLSWFLYLVY